MKSYKKTPDEDRFDRQVKLLRRRIDFLQERIKENKKKNVGFDIDRLEVNAIRTAIKCMSLVRGYYLVSLGIYDLPNYEE